MERTLKDFIDELISKHGHYKNGYLDASFSSLEQHEKEEFAALLMRSPLYSSSFDWLDPSHEELFSQYMLSSHSEDKQKFLDALKQQAIDYYEDTMCDLLEERTAELFADKASNHGLRKTYDAQTGEVTWL